MFSNLSKGSVLYIADRREELKWCTGTVERVVPSISKQYSNMFGQMPGLTLDIVVVFNGEQKEFKQVPSNDIVADFGQHAFIIADSEDSLYNYIKSLLKTSEDILGSIDSHKALVPQYKKVLSELKPGIYGTSEVRELKEQVSSLQNQLAETLALLKSEHLKRED